MRILVGCEYSGRVREAFRKQGHDVWSCDLRPAEDGSDYHLQCDILDVLDAGWDMMVAHPYCTFNCLSGVQWLYHPDDTPLPWQERRRHPRYPDRMEEFLKGAEFFNALKNAPIEKICLENSQPHGVAMMHIGRYDQVLQPWMVGSPFTKGAYLWLKGLPKIIQTHKKTDFEKITAACHSMAPGPDRERERSRTNPAIAEAFALNWGIP